MSKSSGTRATNKAAEHQVLNKMIDNAFVLRQGILSSINDDARNIDEECGYPTTLVLNHRFIEIVLYFYPDLEIVGSIKKIFTKEFGEKQILVFVGSDWNHQSYQAAFGSKDTFYVLLTSSSYKQDVSGVSNATLLKNIETLKVIAKATYLTLKDKSLLFSLR